GPESLVALGSSRSRCSAFPPGRVIRQTAGIFTIGRSSLPKSQHTGVLHVPCTKWPREATMSNLIERTLHRLSEQLDGRLSTYGDPRYASATQIWPKPTTGLPRAIAHCRSPEDVQIAVRAARDSHLALSVRGGGHDWAGRALCDGLVIDLSDMRGVLIGPDNV